MARVKNVDAYSRVWPHLQKPDGSTLELDPGQEGEVASLPKNFEDNNLVVVADKPKRVKEQE